MVLNCKSLHAFEIQMLSGSNYQMPSRHIIVCQAHITWARKLVYDIWA